MPEKGRAFHEKIMIFHIYNRRMVDELLMKKIGKNHKFCIRFTGVFDNIKKKPCVKILKN